MMLVVSAVMGVALYFAERNLVASVEDDLRREFEGKLAALQSAQEVRQAVLGERYRTMARNQRIRGALEEAPDLLYPNVELFIPREADPGERTGYALRPEFYRVLDRSGVAIPAPDDPRYGRLRAEELARLQLSGAPAAQQVGYLWRKNAEGTESVFEIITTPIISTEGPDVIATLVLGFRPFELERATNGSTLSSGIWVDGRLNIPGMVHSATLAAEVTRAVAKSDATDRPGRIDLDGTPHLLFHKRLNADSLYPPAYEVCVFPLTDLHARQWRLRGQILGLGGLLLLGGLGASHYVAARLSTPVEKLAVDSEAQRARLELTHEELQRSARFSADASHQLKTPVTVMRAGLEELLTRDNLTPDECHEISALIHQTYRLSSLVEDLLLLSRMDAGRLKLDLGTVHLSQLIEAALDDLSALPDELGLRVETEFPPDLLIVGEKRYTAIILQNLLENARKYNRPGGSIRIVARVEGGRVLLTVGNNGRPIAPAAQAHIFERFHRGAMGENVPGYGLGLNLARELARLHRGDLRLARSDESWTEFEVRFELARTKVATGGAV